MSLLQVDYIRAFQDNYIWVIKNHRFAVVIDPGDAEPVFDYLYQQNLELGAILITHHHYDHIGGISSLCTQFNAIPVYGPATEVIPNITFPLHGGECIYLDTLGIALKVMYIPGHTLGHIAYYASLNQSQSSLFCGDTLFATGCGKLFEGTPAQMHSSLQALSTLPSNTMVYCTHEYTLSNIRFALTVEPNNLALKRWAKKANDLSQEGRPTVPTTIGHELSTNPFLRCQHPDLVVAVQQQSQHKLNSEMEVFTALRHWKDNFK